MRRWTNTGRRNSRIGRRNSQSVDKRAICLQRSTRLNARAHIATMNNVADHPPTDCPQRLRARLASSPTSVLAHSYRPIVEQKRSVNQADLCSRRVPLGLVSAMRGQQYGQEGGSAPIARR
uniref:Uncharacterized protein n=1 Tax=Plectus sambesii TaxID=2011161 RepID=A0A914X2Y0_9BILA